LAPREKFEKSKSEIPYRQIERGINGAAVRLHERDLLPLEDILDALRISRRTFYWVWKLYRETGSVVAPTDPSQGQPRTLIFDDFDYLLRLVNRRPGWFFDELLHLLQPNRFISVHFKPIFRALEWTNVSRKKLVCIAKERNEVLRVNFIARMAQYDPEELGYVNETSKDKRTPIRRYGRRRGRHATQKGVFVRSHRLSIEALLTVDGIVASLVVGGSMTPELFLEFLEFIVV
jgi:hypothetical protein